MISENDLSGFSGTEQYYKEFMGLKITDGVKYVRDALECCWLISDIAVLNAMAKPILKNKQEGNSFLLVTLKINRGEISREKPRAILTFKEDTNSKVLYFQEYIYSDIHKFYDGDELKFYLIDGVLCLPSEY